MTTKTQYRWIIDGIDQISAVEFHELITRNTAHISRTFPLTLSACQNPPATEAFIITCIQNEQKKENYYFYLRNLETRNLIGYICIKKIDNKLMKCELAYFIDIEFEGKGIITEAVSQVIEFCFSMLRMNKVFICTSKENIASQRIALKQGFKKEGVLRQEFLSGDGILEDVVYFGLLKSEFDER